MKLTFNKQQREYNPKMTVSEFTEANEHNISVDFQEANPMYAYKVNDWDLDMVWDYAQENVEYYQDVMKELYAEYIAIDDVITEWQRERIQAMD